MGFGAGAKVGVRDQARERSHSGLGRPLGLLGNECNLAMVLNGIILELRRVLIGSQAANDTCI